MLFSYETPVWFVLPTIEPLLVPKDQLTPLALRIAEPWAPPAPPEYWELPPAFAASP